MQTTLTQLVNQTTLSFQVGAKFNIHEFCERMDKLFPNNYTVKEITRVLQACKYVKKKDYVSYNGVMKKYKITIYERIDIE